MNPSTTGASLLSSSNPLNLLTACCTFGHDQDTLVDSDCDTLRGGDYGGDYVEHLSDRAYAICHEQTFFHSRRRSDRCFTAAKTTLAALVVGELDNPADRRVARADDLCVRALVWLARLFVGLLVYISIEDHALCGVCRTHFDYPARRFLVA